MTLAIAESQDDVVTAPPAREDGNSWPFALLVGTNTVYGDTLTEIVGHLIDGYTDIADDSAGDELALISRIEYAAGYVNAAQSVVLSAASTDGTFIPVDESEAVLTALLTPRGTALIDGSEFNYEWNLPVPLLLLATDFAPFTDVPPISGNVQVFDPSNERVFLESLSELGAVELFVNASV